MFAKVRLLALFLIYGSVTGSTTKFWINAIPAYSQLDQCAVKPLSTMVRDQSYGCGQSTSYSCFCTSRSSYFNNLISQMVSESCPGTASDITSAQDVFNSYCQLNGTIVAASATHVPQSLITSTAPLTSTSTASPISSVIASTATQTSSINLPTAGSLSHGISKKDILGDSIITAGVAFAVWVVFAEL